MKQKTKQSRTKPISANTRRYYKVYRKYARYIDSILFPEGLPRFMPSAVTGAGSAAEILELFIITPLRGAMKEADFHKYFLNLTPGTIETFIHELLGGRHRDVLRYKVKTPFTLTNGIFRPMGEVPDGFKPALARKLYKNDTILARFDKRDKNDMFIEVQILTNGLFGSDDEDWKVFLLTVQEFSDILKFMKREERIKDGTGFTVFKWYSENYTKLNPK